MKKNTKTQQRPPSGFDRWIERKSAGKEKQFIMYMLVFSFLLLGTVITMHYFREPTEEANYDLDIVPKPIELTQGSEADLQRQYDDTMARDKKMVELLEEYQMLLDQVPIDTLRIHDVQNQIRTLKAYYEKN